MFHKPDALKNQIFEKYGSNMATLKAAATANDPDAQFDLGLLHFCGFEYEGTNLAKDINAAQFWFGEASKQKHAEALFYLGLINQQVEGLTTKTLEFKFKAMSQGYPSAQQSFAEDLFECGKACFNVKDYEQAFRYLPQVLSLIQGNTTLRNAFAQFLFEEGTNHLMRNNYEIAFRCLVMYTKAMQGVSEGKLKVGETQFKIAKMCLEMRLQNPNNQNEFSDTRCRHWLEKSAKNGYAPAESNFTRILFSEGKNYLDRDNAAQAYTCFTRAVEICRQDTALQAEITKFLFAHAKQMLTQDLHDEAIRYFEQALLSSTRNTKLRYTISKFLVDKGKKFFEDNNHQVAFKYLKQATSAHPEQPALRLGLRTFLFENGRKYFVTGENFELALQYLQLFISASMDAIEEQSTIAEAQYYIGVMYARGKVKINNNSDIQENVAEGAKWMERAALSGYEPAKLYFASSQFKLPKKITNTAELLDGISPYMDFAAVITAYETQAFSILELNQEDSFNFRYINKKSKGIVNQKSDEAQKMFTNRHGLSLYFTSGNIYDSLIEVQQRATVIENIPKSAYKHYDSTNRLARKYQKVKRKLMQDTQLKLSIAVNSDETLETIVVMILNRALLKMIVDIKAQYQDTLKSDILLTALPTLLGWASLPFVGPIALLATPAYQMLSLFGRPTTRNRILHASGRIGNNICYGVKAVTGLFHSGAKRKPEEQIVPDNRPFQLSRRN